MSGTLPLHSPIRPWEYSAFRVTVARKQQLAPGFLRITLAGHCLQHFAPWGLDQRIKLVLPLADGSIADFGLFEEPTPHPKQWYAQWKTLPEAQRNMLRTYTPAAIRPDIGEIDVDMFIHEPAGPASTWALTSSPGDPLILTGPDIRCGFTGYGIHYAPPTPPDQLLLIGDETALPAIKNILAAKSDQTTATVFLELTDPSDNFLTQSTMTPATAIHTTTGVARPGDGLLTALAERNPINATTMDAKNRFSQTSPYAWVACEASAATRIRRFLTTELALPKTHVAFQGYWKHGNALIN